MVYGIYILKATSLKLKMDPAMSSPLEAMLQLDFVTYWAHGLQKAVFIVLDVFPVFTC